MAGHDSAYETLEINIIIIITIIKTEREIPEDVHFLKMSFKLKPSCRNNQIAYMLASTKLLTALKILSATLQKRDIIFIFLKILCGIL
jgi:hypothetical protein